MLLLRGIVHSLDTSDEARWDDHIESGQQCVYELFQMSRSPARPYKVESSSRLQAAIPAFERAVRAIPHVKAMNMAIRNQDRPAAIRHGRAAIAEMNGTAAGLSNAPVVPASDDHAAQEAQPNATGRNKSERKSGVAPKRKQARLSTAALS